LDPRGVGTVQIELNNTAAQLLASLCAELEDDAVGVLSRALGVLDLCVRAKQRGDRLCLVNQRGEASDVVI
jgi:hypothetical protein